MRLKREVPVKRVLVAVSLVLVVAACSNVDAGPLPEKQLGKVAERLCTNPNDPNTCFNCATEQECPGDYYCDPQSEHCVAFCTDGVWDGDEGDVDCGGLCANEALGGARCATGKHCWTNWD